MTSEHFLAVPAVSVAPVCEGCPAVAYESGPVVDETLLADVEIAIHNITASLELTSINPFILRTRHSLCHKIPTLFI